MEYCQFSEIGVFEISTSCMYINMTRFQGILVVYLESHTMILKCHSLICTKVVDLEKRMHTHVHKYIYIGIYVCVFIYNVNFIKLVIFHYFGMVQSVQPI